MEETLEARGEERQFVHINVVYIYSHADDKSCVCIDDCCFYNRGGPRP